ncbi:hypothetical protein GQ53DRAFT_708478 [Thozetella sp. PMI_491]|nr:hypothetical protein GQ53DRAFT_708478 [Thozetella sp. PMI_491]
MDSTNTFRSLASGPKRPRGSTTSTAIFVPPSRLSLPSVPPTAPERLDLGPPEYIASMYNSLCCFSFSPKLFQHSANEITVHLGPWEIVGSDPPRVVWQCGSEGEVLEHFLPSGIRSDILPFTLHSQHRRLSDPRELELYVTFMEPHRFRYTTAEGVIHDECIEVKYEFTTVDSSANFQSDIRGQDLVDWFDVDVVWSDQHQRQDSYGATRGLGTIQRVKIWRDRYSGEHYLTFYANMRRRWVQYLVRQFERELQNRNDEHRRIRVNARVSRNRENQIYGRGHLRRSITHAPALLPRDLHGDASSSASLPGLFLDIRYLEFQFKKSGERRAVSDDYTRFIDTWDVAHRSDTELGTSHPMTAFEFPKPDISGSIGVLDAPAFLPTYQDEYAVFQNKDEGAESRQVELKQGESMIRDSKKPVHEGELPTFEEESNSARSAGDTRNAGGAFGPSVPEEGHTIEHAEGTAKPKLTRVLDKDIQARRLGGYLGTTQEEGVAEAPGQLVAGQFSFLPADYYSDLPMNLPELIDAIVELLPGFSSEPPVPPGKTRVRWKCNCGHWLFDDFTELKPGALEALEANLKQLNGSSGTPSQQPQSLRQPILKIQALVKLCWNKMVKPNADSNTLPRHNTSTQVPPIPMSNQEVLHLLLCIDVGELSTTLHQERLGKITDDKELFEFLRRRYFKCRKFWSWLTLRSVKSLALTRFTVDNNSYAEVHKHGDMCISGCICLPPIEKIRSQEYCCTPEPEYKLGYYPVIGSRQLTHYFLKPHSFTRPQRTIYNQLPKRSCGQLMASTDDAPLGWGIHFEEGWHWRTIYFIVVVLMFLGSLAFGITWTITKGDLQGAFAITGVWMTAGSLLLGYLAVRS